MEGVTVGGEFFAFDSERVGLNDRKLREDEMLPLLEAFRDRKFSRLKNLILVMSVAFNVMKTLLGVTHVLQKGNQVRDSGAEMIGEGLKVNRSLQELHLVRLVFFGLCFDCCWGVDREDGEGLGCSVRSCIL
jgi:hypothetical protein